MRALARVIRWSILFAAISFVAILTVSLTSMPCMELTETRFAYGVVLGAGMDADGTLHQSSIGRVAAGVDLYNAGVVDKLHFTGGRSTPNGPAAGQQMALLAISMGVPGTRTSHEDESLSTLQNALFSVPMLAESDSTVLVTEGFHLLRSQLSFLWAGIPASSVCHSTRFRQEGGNARFPASTMMMREVAAFWFNLGRAGVWSVLNAVGVPRASIDPILA